MYRRLNNDLLAMASHLDTDLWMLDSLWYIYDRHRTDKRFIGASAGRPSNKVNLGTFVCPRCFSSKAIHLKAPGLGVCKDRV